MPPRTTKAQVAARNKEGTLAIHIKELPCPNRMMAATWVAVEEDRRDVVLYFGQRRAGTQNDLIGVLVIRIAIDKMVDFIKNANREFFDSLNGRRVRGFVPWLDSLETARLPEERQVFDRASLIAMACTDDDAEIWFYRISPWELHRNSHKGDLSDAIQPVAGVVFDVERLMGLVDRLKEIVIKCQGGPNNGEES